MRKLFTIIFSILIFSISNSQNKQLLYDFTDLPQSLLSNPGSDVFYRSHIGIPFLSQFHFNYGLRGFTPYKILADDGVNINHKVQSLVSTLSNNDHLTINQQMEILSFGWGSRRYPNTYFTAGMYEEFDFIGYVPKEIAEIALYGNQNHINQRQGFYNITAKADLLNVFHFGINKKINHQLTLGGRIKIYSSILNVETLNNTGAITTYETPNGNNIYKHDLANVNIAVKTAGLVSLRDNQNGALGLMSNVAGKSFFGGNLGYGIDLGFTYEYQDQWSITGSIIDLGAIYYNKDIRNYALTLDQKSEGVDLSETEEQNDLQEIADQIKITNNSSKYSSYRPTILNGSIKYSFEELDYNTCNCRIEPGKRRYINSIGLQLFTQFRPRKPTYAASLFYYKRFTNGFQGKVAYTIDDYTFTNVGFIVSKTFKSFNLYLALDNVFEYGNLAKSNSASVQMGINIIRQNKH